MDDTTPVKVHVYDLTRGLARMFSQMYLGNSKVRCVEQLLIFDLFTGKHLDGVWHTGKRRLGEPLLTDSGGVIWFVGRVAMVCRMNFSKWHGCFCNAISFRAKRVGNFFERIFLQDTS